MRRVLPHRTTLVGLLVMLLGTAVTFHTAQRVVRENEERLLADRAQDVQSLLESLGTSYETLMASVSAVAAVTDGDVDQFRLAVQANAPDAASAERAGWALLRRSANGYAEVGVVGSPTPVDQLPPTWRSGLDRAAAGTFTVLGFLDEGLDRRFAMAAGRIGVPGDLVVYNEASLVGATAGAADTPSVLAGLAVAVYVGERPEDEQLLLGFGQLEGRIEETVVDIAGTKVLLRVGATEALAGSFATTFPGILLGAGVLFALAVSALIEVTLRRRDEALAVVADLEHKNRQLDQALEDQRTSDRERARLEAELRQAHHLEALGHLAGGVAHDFNNLLAAILSYADLAADGVEDPQARQDLAEIRSAARRGAALTQQLLQFSRREPVEPVVVELNGRVGDLVRMLERTLGEDVTMTVELTTAATTVLADPHALDQVLLNLIVNARDALESGGSIAVVTERVELDDAAVAHRPGLEAGTHVRLLVRDDGIGMPSEVVEHAFEPFFTTKGRDRGTGLGLATVYGVVQRHHGHVSAHSAPGRGTEIEVLLPAAEPTEIVETPAPSAPSPPSPDRARVVLVVEDEAPVRRALRRMLQGAGYQVIDAADGATAVNEHGDTDIDVLVTDLVMPGPMSGVDVADRFRDRCPELPVLYITGYAADLRDVQGVGGDAAAAVLAKPFSESELLAAVGSALAADDRA